MTTYSEEREGGQGETVRSAGCHQVTGNESVAGGGSAGQVAVQIVDGGIGGVVQRNSAPPEAHSTATTRCAGGVNQHVVTRACATGDEASGCKARSLRSYAASLQSSTCSAIREGNVPTAAGAAITTFTDGSGLGGFTTMHVAFVVRMPFGTLLTTPGRRFNAYRVGHASTG